MQIHRQVYLSAIEGLGLNFLDFLGDEHRSVMHGAGARAGCSVF